MGDHGGGRRPAYPRSPMTTLSDPRAPPSSSHHRSRARAWVPLPKGRRWCLKGLSLDVSDDLFGAVTDVLHPLPAP
jgi:hypothetical protein